MIGAIVILYESQFRMNDFVDLRGVIIISMIKPRKRKLTAANNMPWIAQEKRDARKLF